MNALLPDVLSIEELDFTPEIPCEHSQHPEGVFGHEGPAYYFISSSFPCGHEADKPDFLYICKGGYEDPSPIECHECGARYTTSQCWKVISKVGS